MSNVAGGDPVDPVGSPPGPATLLRVTGLTTEFSLVGGVNPVVTDLSFEIGPGETLGIVGESGSGKSVTVMSILRLLPPNGRTVKGRVDFEGADLLQFTPEAMRDVRGNRIALIPQNPLAALNPVFTIGWQLDEALSVHTQVSRGERHRRVLEVLAMSGLPDPERQLGRYPHEFSGGMRQRILIAMALLNRPSLLLADEPTTALDTTTQAQILRLLDDLVQQHSMGLVLITHNMGVVAKIATRVAVMYRGELVEVGPTQEVFASPLHPYTKLLMDAAPVLPGRQTRAPARPTSVSAPSSAHSATAGCRLIARCPLAIDKCSTHPALTPLPPAGEARSVRCWVAQDKAAAHA